MPLPTATLIDPPRPPVAAPDPIITNPLFPPFAVWGTSGLETMSFALAFFWTAERLAFGVGRAGVGAAAAGGIALALSRTEGVLWLGVLVPLSIAVRVAARGPDAAPQAAARPVAVAVAWMVGPLLAYSAFRYGWFGSLVSNTALVKAHLGLGSLVRGGKYLLLYWATFPLWLPLLAGAWPAVRRLGAPGAYVAALALANHQRARSEHAVLEPLHPRRAAAVTCGEDHNRRTPEYSAQGGEGRAD